MITNNPTLIPQLLNKNKMKMNIHSKKNNIQLNYNRKNTEIKMMTRLIIVKTSSKGEHLIQTMKRKKLLKIGMKKAKIKKMKLILAKDNLKNMIYLKILKMYRIMKIKMIKNQNQNMIKMIFLIS
jgi:hypothetical protein